MRCVKRAGLRSPAHLAWIRSLPCAIAGCSGRAEAAHVRQASGGGMGLKPGDEWTVPLCGVLHHPEQHRLGHRRFDEKHAISLRGLAETLAARSPALAGAGRRVARRAGIDDAARCI